MFAGGNSPSWVAHWQPDLDNRWPVSSVVDATWMEGGDIGLRRGGRAAFAVAMAAAWVPGWSFRSGLRRNTVNIARARKTGILSGHAKAKIDAVATASPSRGSQGSY